MRNGTLVLSAILTPCFRRGERQACESVVFVQDSDRRSVPSTHEVQQKETQTRRQCGEQEREDNLHWKHTFEGLAVVSGEVWEALGSTLCCHTCGVFPDLKSEFAVQIRPGRASELLTRLVLFQRLRLEAKTSVCVKRFAIRTTAGRMHVWRM